MSEDELNIKIDASSHERVPTIIERLKQAGLAMFLGFILFNIIAFWMFPGPGIFGIYMFSSAHPIVGFIGDFTNIAFFAMLAICGVYGWFRGKYFIDRMKSYIELWRFW